MSSELSSEDTEEPDTDWGVSVSEAEGRDLLGAVLRRFGSGESSRKSRERFESGGAK